MRYSATIGDAVVGSIFGIILGGLVGLLSIREVAPAISIIVGAGVGGSLIGLVAFFAGSIQIHGVTKNVVICAVIGVTLAFVIAIGVSLVVASIKGEPAFGGKTETAYRMTILIIGIPVGATIGSIIGFLIRSD